MIKEQSIYITFIEDRQTLNRKEKELLHEKKKISKGRSKHTKFYRKIYRPYISIRVYEEDRKNKFKI